MKKERRKDKTNRPYEYSHLDARVGHQLEIFGFDISNSVEIQKDLHFLRKLRHIHEKFGSVVWYVGISIALATVFQLSFDDIKGMLDIYLRD